MSNSATDWLTPAGIGAATALIIQVATFLLQKSKIKVDDDSSFRKDLIVEREQLIADIRTLSERFSKLEQENHDLRLGQVELQKNLGLMEIEKARNLSDIDALKKKVKELEHQGVLDKAEIARLKGEIKELKNAKTKADHSS
jgi:chromosome segregation ATPase